jgi:hypothetical protein
MSSTASSSLSSRVALALRMRADILIPTFEGQAGVLLVVLSLVIVLLIVGNRDGKIFAIRGRMDTNEAQMIAV